MSNTPDKDMATRDSWKLSALPVEPASLGFAATYSSEDFARIRRGLIPAAMEDKWFIFFEEPWLYFHRSWTGYAIYGLRFQQESQHFRVVEAWANRNACQYTETDSDYDCALLQFLVEAFLLGRATNFPVRKDLTPAGVFQHSAVGRAYPETALQPGQGKPGVFDRIRRLLRLR